uniref:Uncharacterized protein n=1 Tax=Sphaerodactylus townsendi TaxID=933632 RepID=A0ACB8FQY0_9SAUR
MARITRILWVFQLYDHVSVVFSPDVSPASVAEKIRRKYYQEKTHIFFFKMFAKLFKCVMQKKPMAPLKGGLKSFPFSKLSCHILGSDNSQVLCRRPLQLFPYPKPLTTFYTSPCCFCITTSMIFHLYEGSLHAEKSFTC